MAEYEIEIGEDKNVRNIYRVDVEIDYAYSAIPNCTVWNGMMVVATSGQEQNSMFSNMALLSFSKN